MLRNSWDTEQYARHHIDALTREMHHHHMARRAARETPSLLLLLRQRAGLALIRAGQMLAGPEPQRSNRPAAMRLAG